MRVTSYLETALRTSRNRTCGGSRAVTDFDGERWRSGSARRWRADFTPTIAFPAGSCRSRRDERAGSGDRAHAGLFPSAAIPVDVRIHRRRPHAEQDFQRYLRDRFAQLREAGTDPENW